MSPRNKKTSGFQKLQKPIAGTLLVSMALGQPVWAQTTAAPSPGLTPPPVAPGVPRPRPISAAPATAGAATVASSATNTPGMPATNVSPAPGLTPPPVVPGFQRLRPPTAAPVAAGAASEANSSTNFSPLLSSDLPPGKADQLVQVNYVDAPLDQLTAAVSDWTGRMLIKAPGVNAQITLKSNERIPISQALEAIETILAMNNVSLVKMGDKFLKVVPIAQNRTEGGAIMFQNPEKPYPEADQLVSQMVRLNYLEVAEAQPMLQPLLHGYGKIQPFELNRSLLITETGANLNRILEVLAFIDKPSGSKPVLRIVPTHAKPSEIEKSIKALIADTQSKEEKPRIEQPAAPVPAIPTPPGIIRAPRPATSTTPSGQGVEAGEGKQLINHKVIIVPDDRVSLLFIIACVDDLETLMLMVNALDQATLDDEFAPPLVYPLAFAKADEIASILNEFIGAAKEDPSKGNQAPTTPAPTGTAGSDARSVALRDYVASRQAAAAAAATRSRLAPITDAGKDLSGRVSPDTRILADKRTNKLLIMGRNRDLTKVVNLIKQIDVMLAQVLIEVVIIKVDLGNKLNYGVDWLQQSMTAYNTTKAGPGGISVNTPILSFGGGTAFGGAAVQDGALVNRSTPLAANKLTYYTTLNGLNIDAVIQMAKVSSDGRILQTPVIITTDNKEAKIKVGSQVPIVNANIVQTTGQNTQNYEYKDIGLDITITPHINPDGVVEMEIKQQADDIDPSSTVFINGVPVPTITSRSLSADVSVKNNQTIILGGLTDTHKSKSQTGIPLLMSIPIIGGLFRSDELKDTRSELLVLLTPYVLKSPEQAREETARLHANSSSSKTQWHEGWSDSPLPRMTEKDLKELLKARSDRIKANETNETTAGSIAFDAIMRQQLEKYSEPAAATNAPATELIVPPAMPPPANVQPAPAPVTVPAAAPVIAPEAVPTPAPVAAPAVAPAAAAKPPVEAAPQQPAAPAPAPAAAPGDPSAAPAPRGK